MCVCVCVIVKQMCILLIFECSWCMSENEGVCIYNVVCEGVCVCQCQTNVYITGVCTVICECLCMYSIINECVCVHI